MATLCGRRTNRSWLWKGEDHMKSPWAGFELTTLVVIGTDCCYHTIVILKPQHIHVYTLKFRMALNIRRVWRYQRWNQKPYIEEEQTTQWPKEKVQKGKQWSTKHTHKTTDRVTRTPLKTGGELMCSGTVGSKLTYYTILNHPNINVLCCSNKGWML